MAVLVGCNYPNSRNELHGCINDVVAMRELLVKRFRFESTHIQLLVDSTVAGLSSVMPTGINIKKALDAMVDEAKPGDVLFFHYSGHGTRIPSLKPGHPFRQDEAIVPCDFNLITDMDFRQLVNRLPKGTSFTILSDSCHSGGLIDKEKEQIGPNHISTNTTKLRHISKSIPFESIIEHLASLTGINTSDTATHFLELFGADASLKFKLPKFKFDDPSELEIKPDEGILLSGCQANETSADMNPIEKGEKAYGAFSNSVQMVLKQHLEVLSNNEVVLMARKVLETQGFDQHPCLYCSDKNADSAFLWQLEN
ncbi:hypothetical protein JCGZ_09712 [Jatropha curcas]|uniref:Peptidase C14 caspase domain-containing protein n=2 Tax=Jatropha curcas TaxID=180498 RepID=A0A067LDZ0_JATCU|nr:hypothetical protein JCGZ_09712 [Jatropha curcas]